MQNSLEKAGAQLIVVQATEGCLASLTAFESNKKILGPFDAVLGKNGPTSHKREGDGKTPIGLYPLLDVFGTEEHRTSQMPFIALHEHLEAVDDPASKHYNAIVDRRKVEVDWKSSEKMKEMGFLYDLGVVIGYNTPNPIPGNGSCIFLHVWRSSTKGTAGCVALSLPHLQAIAKWLSANRSPHILIKGIAI